MELECGILDNKYVGKLKCMGLCYSHVYRVLASGNVVDSQKVSIGSIPKKWILNQSMSKAEAYDKSCLNKIKNVVLHDSLVCLLLGSVENTIFKAGD